jgi:type II secretory pathway pseudopilin PulG
MSKSHLNQSSRPYGRGFSLVETAIVMGIVGLIVGGIWAWAALPNSQVLANQATDELYAIVNNGRGYYSGRALPSTPCASLSTLTSVPASTGIFPSGMGVTATSGTAAPKDPWGNTVSAYACVSAAGPTVLAVRFSNLSRKLCIDMIAGTLGDMISNTNTSGGGAGMNLFRIDINDRQLQSATNGIIGVSDAAAKVGACANGAHVDWYYKLAG